MVECLLMMLKFTAELIHSVDLVLSGLHVKGMLVIALTQHLIFN